MAIAEQKTAENSAPPSPISEKLKPVEPKTSLTSRTWNMEDGSVFHLAELPHNHDAADPKSRCASIISVPLNPGSFSEKLAYCRSCREPVVVNLTMICFELGLESLRSTLIIPNHSNQDEIQKNREGIMREIENYRASEISRQEAAEQRRKNFSINGWLKS